MPVHYSLELPMIFADPVNNAPKATHKNKMPLAVLALLSAMAILPACSTVSVNRQASAKTISAQRGNIVTDNKLSSDTASLLLSAGLNEQACMQQFELCLTQLADSMLNRHYRPALAAFQSYTMQKRANSLPQRAVAMRLPVRHLIPIMPMHLWMMLKLKRSRAKPRYV